MVTDLSNICAVVIFRVKVWPPLSMLLQAVTIRNSAIQGLHSHIYIYYINTNEIPGEFSCENLISSHVKTTCYLHM